MFSGFIPVDFEMRFSVDVRSSMASMAVSKIIGRSLLSDKHVTTPLVFTNPYTNKKHFKITCVTKVNLPTP
jgi:hypothetical protein